MRCIQVRLARDRGGSSSETYLKNVLEKVMIELIIEELLFCPVLLLNFVKLTFVKWSTVCRMASKHFSIKDKRNGNREVYCS